MDSGTTPRLRRGVQCAIGFYRKLSSGFVNFLLIETVNIEREKDYLSDYKANISKNDQIGFSALLETNRLKRYQHGIVLLCAYLNPLQDKADFSDFITSKYDIEHILPKKWNHYDGWTDKTWAEQLNTLGNLIPLTKALNIAAKNEFFDRKKTQYKKSTIQDALDLLELSEWTPEQLNTKLKEKVERLLTYCKIPHYIS